MRKRKAVRTALYCFLPALLFVSFSRTNIYADEIFTVHNAWMPEAPPNARVIAGYMTIENRSSQSRTLIGVVSDQFQKVEIHRTELQGDMVKMLKLESLDIPSGGRVTLQPGSYHLMLTGPESVPKEGKVVHIILLFDNGLTKQVGLTVRSLLG